jgi:hypothetical protein
MARSVWSLIDEELVEHLSADNIGDPKQWLFHQIQTLNHEDFIKVLGVLWAIWTERRKAIHEGIFQSPLTVYGFINNFLSELKVAMLVQVKNPKSCPRSQPTWTAPSKGMLKFNVDGA